MIKNFNISLFELKFLDLNFIYDLMHAYRREEKSREFIQMALAGVDLSKSSAYQNFIRENNQKPAEIEDPEAMEDVKKLSLQLLKGGRNG
jgi:hypothetical protein